MSEEIMRALKAIMSGGGSGEKPDPEKAKAEEIKRLVKEEQEKRNVEMKKKLEEKAKREGQKGMNLNTIQERAKKIEEDTEEEK